MTVALPAGVAPAHNIAAERSVLGAVLLTDVALPALLLEEGLRPEHFYRDSHRVIWQAMSAMSAAGQPVDVLTLSTHLANAGTLEAAGGKAMLDELTGGVPSLGSVRRYAQIVIEDWRWRWRVDAAYGQLAATQDRDEAAHQRAVTSAGAELVAAAGPNVFELLSVADLADLKPPEFLIDTLLPAGGFSVLFGPSGVGKSFLALDWALCIANGIAWYGQTARPGWVLYICAEGRSGLGIRVQAWQQARRQREVERIRFLPDAVNFLDAAQLAKARLTMAALPEPPVLVVADTMARSMVGGDENAARDVGVFIAAVDDLCKTSGAARLIVHHTGKNGEDERGSSALRGAADLMAALKPDGAGVRLECVKAKDSEPFEPWNLHLDQVGESCVLRLGSNQAAIGEHERQILEQLSAGFGSNPVATGVLQRSSGVAERSYYRALKALEDKGYVTREGTTRTTKITLTEAGAQALLPTTANYCPAAAAITAANPPSLGVGSGSSDGLATDDEQHTYDRATSLIEAA